MSTFDRPDVLFLIDGIEAEFVRKTITIDKLQQIVVIQLRIKLL